MELLDIHTMTAPNIYSLDLNVVVMRVRLGNFKDTPTRDIGGFNDNIIRYFPGLTEHKCTKGYKGGFIDRLKEGTYLAHVTEHLCLEVQTMLGIDISFGKARNESDDIYKVVFACENTIIGKACAYFIFDIVSKLVLQQKSEFEQGFERLRRLYNAHHIGVSTGAILDEAKKRGIPANEIMGTGLIRLGYGKYQRYISATLFENTSSIAVDIACDKALTKALLDEVSIPIPEGQVCLTSQEAIRCAGEIGYPLVVKPKLGNKGKQVTINIDNDEDLVRAFNAAFTEGPEVIVEKFIQGKDYRILVINGRVVAAAERIPARVIGDGKHTVKQLVDRENLNEMRGEDHEKPLTKIMIDENTIRVLAKQGMDLEAIPSPGQPVYLRTNSNLSTGGTAIDCTDIIHPYNKEIAETAVRAIGLDIAGIDMVIPDISQPISKDYGAIVEVNAAPGIRMHLHPTEGTPRDVVSPILDMVYPSGKKFSIPIIAITGTNGKTTTTRMINHILTHSGYQVGMTTTNGIYINGKCIENGDTTGYRSAKRILNNRNIDIAVLETARGGIIRNGLAYQRADIAVFTNLTNDHLGVDGVNSMEELLHTKSLVTEAVKEEGYCVLNADDPWVLKAKEKAGGKVILFTMNHSSEAFEDHLQAGGCGIFVRENSIYVSKNDTVSYVIGVRDIPATLGGKLKHNIYNSMAAIGACYASGVSLIGINKALRLFASSPEMNPGRFNIFNLPGDIKVVLDYGHNYDGYSVTIDSLKALHPNKLIGVIGVPGDRRNEDIFKVGKLAGQSFDELIIKEDSDLRDRQPYEVADILKAGASAYGHPENIKIIQSEEEAFKHALENANSGDVVAVFFEKMEPLVEIIKKDPTNTLK